MAPSKDLYAALELQKGASVAEVKKAYKRLARKYHPDLNPGDKRAEDRFKEISEAHAILSNPEKKKQYDAFGHMGEAPPRGRGVHFEGFDFDAQSTPGGFEDLFETFLHSAQAGPKTGPVPGEDLVFPLNLTLEEAYAGKKTRLAIRHNIPCEACGGEGRTTPRGKSKPCAACNGTGKAGLNRGPFSFSRPCPRCGGSGNDPGPACEACGGRGVTEATQSVDVAIPAGVDTGSRVRLKGKGQAGLRGGPPGDLYIETHIVPHPRFRREGPNLLVEVAITVVEAVLGGRIDIPTLGGGATMKIPPGTSSGQVFRLKERGMPSLRGGPPGDLLVTIAIVAPKVVDERSKEILREFERLNPEDPRTYTAGKRG
jgi:molecular chaperone DnaJ